MTVIILERVPPGLRGLLSRWMLEVATGVFAGRTSARVRDQLWRRVACDAEQADGSAILLHNANTPQGFAIRQVNGRGRFAEPIDGLWLVRLPGRGT